MDKHLRIEPQELCFHFQLRKEASCLVRLSNKTSKHVAFKVMTTSPEKYCVRPNMGTVSPGSSCDVTVTMFALNDAPQNMQCKDKFSIRSAFVSPVATTKEVQELLKSKVGDLVQQCKLGVIYTLPPQVPSEVVVRPRSVRKLLDVQPAELQFRFELKKQLSCLFQLSNMTEHRVGFKVKTTDPRKYFVQPNIGIVSPRSTCNVIGRNLSMDFYSLSSNTEVGPKTVNGLVVVRMLAQTTIPLDGQCKDKFLVQSIVASPAVTRDTVTPEMFETGHGVEEFKLKVVYSLPPHPQSSNSQTSEAVSSPKVSALPERNLNDNTEVVQGINRTETNAGDFVDKCIFIGLLGLIMWFLVMKFLPLIWSVIFVITMLAGKMIKSVISDSVEDWIVKALVYIFVHFVSVLLGRKWNIASS